MKNDNASIPAPAVSAQAQNAFQGDLFAHLGVLSQDWQGAFSGAREQAALHKLDSLLQQRLADGVQIFPLRPFRALLEIAPQDVQVIILGQDPYHGPKDRKSVV